MVKSVPKTVTEPQMNAQVHVQLFTEFINVSRREGGVFLYKKTLTDKEDSTLLIEGALKVYMTDFFLFARLILRDMLIST